MKKIILLITLISLFNGCSQKITSLTPKCQNIERKMLDLKQEKNLNLTAKVANTVTNGYPYGQSSKEIEQKIQILNMELEECKRQQLL